MTACSRALLILAGAAVVSPGPALTMRGTVVDAQTRLPVPYAEVRPAGFELAAFTDSSGLFFLDLPDSVAIVGLEAARVGYNTRTWPKVDPRRRALLYLMPQAIPLRGVTVTARRAPESAARSGPVTVIDSADLSLRGRAGIAGALAAGPSGNIQDYGNMTTVALRGATSEQTLILLDGVRLNTAQDNLVDLSSLPLSMARRIEVVRGGSSALYGANSVGGVANIITPEPERLAAAATAGLGSFGRRYLQVTHANWQAPVGYWLGLNLDRAGDSFAYRDSADSVRIRRNSGFSGTDIMARGLYRAGRHQASALGQYRVSRRGVPGPLSWPSDSARLYEHRGIVHLDYALQESDHARLEAVLYAHRFWRSFRDPNPYSPVSDTHVATVTGLHLTQRADPARWCRAVAGLELEREQFQSTTVGRPTRTTRAGWGEAELSWSGFTCTPMLRYDYVVETRPMPDSIPFRTIHSIASPKVMLGFAARNWLNLYAGIGRSFRAPTFNELYWPEDLFTAGNPRLQPEWATSLDLGISGEYASSADYQAGVFHSRMTGLIQWQPDSSGVWRPVNVDSATVTGVELQAGLTRRFYGVRTRGTWMIARSAGKDLIYRPRISGRLSGWFGPGWARLTLTGQAIGRRYTAPGETDSMPAHLTWDAELSIAPRLGRVLVTARAGVRNALDRQYEVMKDYPVPGRNWYAELELGI